MDEELSLKDMKVEHIYDIDKIVEMGIAFRPAIAFDNKSKATGRIPEVGEITKEIYEKFEKETGKTPEWVKVMREIRSQGSIKGFKCKLRNLL